MISFDGPISSHIGRKRKFYLFHRYNKSSRGKIRLRKYGMRKIRLLEIFCRSDRSIESRPSNIPKGSPIGGFPRCAHNRLCRQFFWVGCRTLLRDSRDRQQSEPLMSTLWIIACLSFQQRSGFFFLLQLEEKPT